MIERPDMTAWDRLQNPLTTERGSKYRFSARHMPSLLRKLHTRYTPRNQQFIGDITPTNADTIRRHILGNFDPAAVNWAHEACVREYQMHNPKAYKPRMNFKSGAIENEGDDSDAMENALLDDDTPRDQAWLDKLSDTQTPDEPKVEPEPVKDNSQGLDAMQLLGQLVTRPQLNQAMGEQRQFFTDGIQRLKNGIHGDIMRLDKELASVSSETLKITDELSKRIAEIEKAKPLQIEIKTVSGEIKPLDGLHHKHFPDMLAMCQAKLGNDDRLNIWTYGPAGTGKTTAAKHVAKALGLNFYSMGALETGYQILGYNDGNGQYVTTHFRNCWQHGGVIALDECDSYTPSASLALNGALANGFCAFADKLVERHKDCIIIAGANTTGLGGTIEYVGRMKQDAAFLDRFVMLDWPIDETLEDALCENKKWLGIVRYARNKVIQIQMKGAMITPRATIYGDALLKAGLPLSRVLHSTLKKGMTDAQWSQIAPPSGWDI